MANPQRPDDLVDVTPGGYVHIEPAQPVETSAEPQGSVEVSAPTRPADLVNVDPDYVSKQIDPLNAAGGIAAIVAAARPAAEKLFGSDASGRRSLETYLKSQISHKYPGLDLNALEKEIRAVSHPKERVATMHEVQRALNTVEGRTPGVSAVDLTAYEKAAKPTTVAGKIAQPIKKVGEFVEQINPFKGQGIGSTIMRTAGRGALGAGTVYQGSQAWNKALEGDYPGAAIDAAGALGSGLMLVPHPIAKGAGAALTGASMLGDYLYDSPKEKELKGMAAGGLSDGGESNTTPFIGYPHINKNRKVGSGTGFLDALVGAEPSRTSVLNPEDSSYMSGYEAGKPYGIVGEMLQASPLGIAKAGAMKGAALMGAMSPKQAQITRGFLESTPKNINPLVGTRFDLKDLGNIAESTPRKLEDYRDAMATLIPYDATTRNKQILSVSGRPLTEDVFTHGGRDYVLDKEHIAQGIGGASGEGIAKRVQGRTDIASREGEQLGGSGKTIMLPSTMGKGAENFAVPTWQIYKNLFDQAEHSPEMIKQFSDQLRSKGKTNPKTKITTYPFADMPDINSPEALSYFLQSGDARKAFIKQQMDKKNQRILGANAEDISAALTDPRTASLPRGFLGGNIIETVPGAKVTPSSNITYNTNFAGTPGGHFDVGDVPAAVMLHKPYAAIFEEMQAKYPNKPWQAVHDMTMGALERRKEGVSQLINEETINRVGQYQHGLQQGKVNPLDTKSALDYLNQPGIYAEGGSVMPNLSLDVREMPNMTGQPGVGYMQTPQGAMARLQMEKEMELARLRAGISGMGMAIPGQQGVKMMPGQMDIGANIPVGRGNLDISANRSINPIPGRGHMQGVNARYTLPFKKGGLA